MSQSLSTQITPSLKPSPISVEDVRSWTKVMEGGNWSKLMQDSVDAKVEWMHISPADGPLGKTTPVSGVYNSGEEVIEQALRPILAQFVDSHIKFEILDVFIQPSEMNDASERHLTKAVFEMKGSAIMKKNGKGWNNYYV
ncbi:hypothetical protein FRB98_000468 [Tulasnella sp. 332]|nr:hypothetical protein FRB98_000468 [Tulasnella sp. 332]